MLGVGWEYLSGRHVLEWMALRTARRAGNVGGRLGVVYAEQCVMFILLLTRYLVMGLSKRCAGVRAR